MDSNCRTRPHPDSPFSEFTDLGYYEPGFIHLRINTHDDLTDLSRLRLSNPPNWTPTFFHEYIHFLQDITSTHGLLNFIHANEHLRNANKSVLYGSAVKFQVPVQIANDHNWITNQALMKIFRGRETPSGHRVKSIDYLSYRSQSEQVVDKCGEVINVPKFIIEYFDRGAQARMSCHFGSVHLKEYMAHALQAEFAPETRHDDLPYLLAGLIVKKELPLLAEHPSLVIALCDASLMDFHPSRTFFSVIEQMKNGSDSIPADIDGVYALAMDGLFFPNSKTLESTYEEFAHQAAEAFQDSLRSPVFENNVLWFKEVIGQAINLRLRERGFFSRLVSSPGSFSPLFWNIIDLLGIPFTTNADSKGCFVPPEKLKGLKIEPYYPKVFQAISKTYCGVRPCSLHSFCEADTSKKTTNADCLHQPWERVHDPELCPYAQMWKMWGLKGRTPV